MSATIDELTVNYEENDQLLIKELDKVILTRGAWTTILFRYQQWNADAQDYEPEKYMIRRYRKISGEFKVQSKFVISNREQAKKIIAVLQTWIADEATPA
jgi:hypothetical protein